MHSGGPANWGQGRWLCNVWQSPILGNQTSAGSCRAAGDAASDTHFGGPSSIANAKCPAPTLRRDFATATEAKTVVRARDPILIATKRSGKEPQLLRSSVIENLVQVNRNVVLQKRWFSERRHHSRLCDCKPLKQWDLVRLRHPCREIRSRARLWLQRVQHARRAQQAFHHFTIPSMWRDTLQDQLHLELKCSVHRLGLAIPLSEEQAHSVVVDGSQGTHLVLVFCSLKDDEEVFRFECVNRHPVRVNSGPRD
ncbi:hypothetical protein ZWY2020_008162 [Hordeum vulgare]|nr:hypothetical protein ZWY2020_008162 [Hordeum vulgare]